MYAFAATVNLESGGWLCFSDCEGVFDGVRNLLFYAGGTDGLASVGSVAYPRDRVATSGWLNMVTMTLEAEEVVILWNSANSQRSR